MAGEESLYKYFGFTVWSNRVEYVTGWWLFKKTLTLPVRKMSSVDASAATNKLTITMDDGKKHVFHVMNVHKARDAIVGLM